MIARFRSSKPAFRFAAFLLAATALSGCNMLDRLANVGSEPPLNDIKDPTRKRDYQPVSMPMPNPVVAQPNPNSLWRPGARAFFKDQRAADVGDILTVIIAIDSETAVLSNTSNRSRTPATETASLTSLMGYEGKLAKFLPSNVNPTSLVDFTSESQYTGTGGVTRSETVTLRLAASIIQVLPNGNLVISGNQEIRVNFEIREVKVSGIIRSQDITSVNTIKWDQIAEARISYGGRGGISDVQQPRYGQQVFDILFPF